MEHLSDYQAVESLGEIHLGSTAIASVVNNGVGSEIAQNKSTCLQGRPPDDQRCLKVG